MKVFQKNNRKRYSWRVPALALLVFALGPGGDALAEEPGSGIRETEVISGSGLTPVQHRGPPEGRGPRHGRGGGHCPEMDKRGGCRGGMGHQGGMGMHHGGGQAGSALCPQPRQTVQAPDEFYNLVNPLGNTADNIEKGRLLFSLDVQPTCVMCHGAQGDGTGGFGADMSPKPRNFTCAETMSPIPDGQLFWVIRNGSPDTGMPPFQDLRDEQIWQLILYIRSLGGQ